MSFLSLPVDRSKFRFYKKPSGHGRNQVQYASTLYGLELEKGKIHKSVGFNQFESNGTPIPKEFKREKTPPKGWIERWMYDPARKSIYKTDPKVTAIRVKHKGWKSYLTHNNGGSPFLVYIKHQSVAVYRQPESKDNLFIPENDNESGDEKWHYVIPVATYSNVIRIFVGQSPKTPMTVNSGGHGREFTGNSILVQVSKMKYVHIGAVLYSFTSRIPIDEYWSPVGNSDVPYPVAFSKLYAYFMLDGKRVPLASFTRTLTRKDKQDLYGQFYGNGDEHLLPRTKGTDFPNFTNYTTIYDPPY